MCPPLSDEDRVHLTVFTPGTGRLCEGAVNFKAHSPYGVSENVSGCYQEWDIPMDLPSAGGLDRGIKIPAPGTWRWPERV